MTAKTFQVAWPRTSFMLMDLLRSIRAGLKVAALTVFANVLLEAIRPGWGPLPDNPRHQILIALAFTVGFEIADLPARWDAMRWAREEEESEKGTANSRMARRAASAPARRWSR